MPRHFGDEEKEHIRAEIVKAGTESFHRYGFKKTNIDEIVRLAGVSKGTFYSLFNSKEDFFVEILLSVEQQIHGMLEEQLLNSDLPVKEAFLESVFAQLKYVSETPLLNVLTQPEEYRFLFRKLRPEQIEQFFSQDKDYIDRILGRARERTEVRDVDTEVLTGVMRGIAMLVLHQREIGEEVFADSLRLLLPMVAEYLFPEGETNDRS